MAARVKQKELSRYASLLTARGSEKTLRIMRLLISAHREGMAVGVFAGNLFATLRLCAMLKLNNAKARGRKEIVPLVNSCQFCPTGTDTRTTFFTRNISPEATSQKTTGPTTVPSTRWAPAWVQVLPSTPPLYSGAL